MGKLVMSSKIMMTLIFFSVSEFQIWCIIIEQNLVEIGKIYQKKSTAQDYIPHHKHHRPI